MPAGRKKKERPTRWQRTAFPLSPGKIRTVSTDWYSLHSMIMKNKDFFKPFLDFQQHICALYEQEARNFQLRYNASHPDCHIWRHMLYQRTFYFYSGGHHICVCIEILRFRYAHTFRTFTFYGSLLCPFSHFSADFIRQAVAEAGLLFSQTASLVTTDTLRRWAHSMPSAASHSIPCPNT